MPSWLTDVVPTEVPADVPTLALRLLLAWFCGWVVALLARRNRPSGTPDTLTLTLVLMSILIAMATQIIGDNIARAFSLVGALSIVRFRTAVPAPRDVAFVLAAVVVGMAIGAGHFWVAGLGLVIIGLATEFNSKTAATAADSKPLAGNKKPWRITIEIGLSQTDGCETELARFADEVQLTSAETIRRGSAIELVYRVRMRPESNAVDMIAALNTIPSVESVAVKAP